MADPPDLPERFQPQTLRQFIMSYTRIAMSHQTETRVDDTTGTKGAITDPERRLAPESIEPWSAADCEQERSMIATLLREVDGMGADHFAFPARYHIDCVGEDLGRLDSENALLHFDNDTLHKPAARILRALPANDRIRAALVRRQQRQQHQQQGQHRQVYRPGMVSFTTHLNRLRQTAGRKRKREAAIIVPVLGPADVFCIFEAEKLPPSDNINVSSGPSEEMPSNTPELLFLKEAKASHKLTEHIIDEAVAGAKILDPRTIMGRGGGDSNDTEDCEYWFAAVCAQIYTSMIDKGLRYGIISTGARYVFLSIDPDDFSTLRYSLCRPSLDIAVSPMMRVVSLALLALQHGSLPDGRQLKTIRDGGGLVWTTATASFTTGNSTEQAETDSWKDSPGQMDDQSPSLPDQPSDHGLEEGLGGCTSPSLPATPPRSRPAAIEARRREALYPSPPPQGDSTAAKRHREDDSDVDSMLTHSAKRAKTQDIGLARSPTSPSSPARLVPAQYISPRDRQFCTQKCLQFLKLGPEHAQVDAACPNWAEHQRGGSLTGEQFCEALLAQLTMNLKYAPPHLGHGYQFLNFLPGHTQMIKLRLCDTGHVLLAKAFDPYDLRVMKREARCYHHLRHLQGNDIPVCLGIVELPLDHALTYDGFLFTGLLLLAWAGIGPNQWAAIGGGIGYGGEADHAFTNALQLEVSKALGKIHKAGILHRDIALRNVLIQHYALNWTPRPECRLQVSIIDFELSRNRAMYKHYETKRQRQRGSATRDLNWEFAEALVKEMDACADAIGKWCPNKQIDA